MPSRSTRLPAPRHSLGRSRAWARLGRAALPLCLGLALGCGGRDATFEHGDPGALALIERALESSVLGKEHVAFAQLEAGLDEFPRSFELRREYAGCAVRTERLALGIEAFELLLAAEPEEVGVARSLAHACLSGGFLARAEAPIQWLSARADADAFDLDLASRLTFERGDLDAAASWAERARALAPEDPAVAFQLARVRVAAGDPETRAALERTLELDPGQTQARFALGTLELQTGHDEAGQRQLKLREEVRRLDGKAFRALAAKPRLEAARQLSRELPDWSAPLLEVARAQLELGQPKKAQETLRRAAELRPDSLERAELNYAAALARGEQASAAEWLAVWKEKSGRQDP